MKKYDNLRPFRNHLKCTKKEQTVPTCILEKEDVQLDLDNKSGTVYGPKDNASIYVTIWTKSSVCFLRDPGTQTRHKFSKTHCIYL
jgi:outer membrane receptor for monomeric catechols